MFDLKFHSSVLDKMPVGTSFRDSGHEIVKKNEGWECEACFSSPLEDSSSAYMGSSSRERSLTKFAGAEIDPDNLDPRLLSFLPAGTKVADRDTQSSHPGHWYKTKTGRWVWAESQEDAETSANEGMGVEDLSGYDHLRPFRLVSSDTTDPVHRYDIDELSLIDNKILLDDDGDRWVKIDDKWFILHSDGISGLSWGDHLSSAYGPYKIAEGSQEITERQAKTLKEKVLVDREGDPWAFVDGKWSFRSGSGFIPLTRQDKFGNYAPFSLYHDQSVHPKSSEVETEPEAEQIPEGKTRFSAAEATNFKDCRFRDQEGDVWVFDEDIERWRFILSDGSLSRAYQHVALSAALGPFTLVEGETEVKAEPEAEPAEKTEFSAAEASEHKDLVFKDDDGDTWFFDYGLQRWRAIGSDWAYAKEELDGFYGPYTKVGPYYEFERGWTAEEASEFKDEALEDSDGDTWIYDVPSEMWKCSNRGALDRDELDAYYQPYRIKKAAQARTAAPEAVVLGDDEPFVIAGGTEEVTFEGSAKEAVELLDRIAQSLESIDRKLGDK